MNPRLLKAPANHGDVLAVPAFEAVPALVDSNRKRLDDRFRDLRRLARKDLNITDDAPIILTGHQPELFHPGVWVKNFAANGLARRLSGHAVNLIVDTDTVKSASIRVLKLATVATLGSLPFDTITAETPYESRSIKDPTCFASFGERLDEFTRGWPFRPIGIGCRHDEPRSEFKLGDQLTAIRKRVELGWGCDNRELAVSAMSQFESFREFAKLIIADVARFRNSYNNAIRSYRIANRLHSRNHPAPELDVNELPFWTMIDGTRQRTFHIDDLDRIRPKALILTLFARLILGDFFIHGLGGGKYDVVTDAIIRDFYGIEPPAYQILTATLHLPFEVTPIDASKLSAIRRLLRDQSWNPQRHLQSPEATARHQAVVDMSQDTRIQRRDRYRAFRNLLEGERMNVDELRKSTARKCDDIERQLNQQSILTRRDYAWILHPESVLQPFLMRFLDLASVEA